MARLELKHNNKYRTDGVKTRLQYSLILAEVLFVGCLKFAYLLQLLFPCILDLSHRNQFLSTGRVDGDTVIKVLLGGAHLDGDSETLEHLSTSKSQNV